MEGSTLNTCWLLRLKPSVSRAAYRVLMNSEALLLPGEENVCDLMNKTSSDSNLKKPFYEIMPKKLLVNRASYFQRVIQLDMLKINQGS